MTTVGAHAEERPEERRHSRRRIFLLSVLLSAGVLLWAVHLVGISTLVPAACEHGVTWAIHVLTAVTAVPTAAALWLSWLLYRGGTDLTGSITGRTHLLAFLAVLFNAINLVLIVFESIPAMVLSPCV